jgi:hypothetical protein
MGLSLVNMLCLSSNVHFAHIQHVTENLFILDYTQVLCQYRLCRADHSYLTYLVLQRQLSHLNGLNLTTAKFKHSLILHGVLVI